MTPFGILRGLSECASRRGTFTILALDHRQNLRRDLRPASPATVSGTELTDFKRQVVGAIGDAATGVLLDPEYGAPQCIADGSMPGSVGLIVALEATGYLGPATDRTSRLLDGWGPQSVRRLGASAAKLLVYYHPDALSAARQEQLVESVARQCRELELPLFLEPLTFSPLDGQRLTGEDRRRAVIDTARRLGGLGVDVLKVEFPYDLSVTDRRLWHDACAELNSVVSIPWVLLSGGADPETFNAQVTVACAAGASGVAAGRAIWAEATTTAAGERESFLRDVAYRRLTDLAALIDGAARPWTEAAAFARSDAPIAEDWYRH